MQDSEELLVQVFFMYMYTNSTLVLVVFIEKYVQQILSGLDFKLYHTIINCHVTL